MLKYVFISKYISDRSKNYNKNCMYHILVPKMFIIHMHAYFIQLINIELFGNWNFYLVLRGVKSWSKTGVTMQIIFLIKNLCKKYFFNNYEYNIIEMKEKKLLFIINRQCLCEESRPTPAFNIQQCKHIHISKSK